MSLILKTRKIDNIAVMDMSGRLVIGEATLLLRATVRKFLEDGTTKFVLNLGDVSFIDSSGLGELITAYTSIRNREGDVKMLDLAKRAKDLLQMTKLLTVFDVYDSEVKAIQAMQYGKLSERLWRP